MSYAFSGKGTIYFAIVDPVQANITVKARGNFSALETKEIIEKVEERFLKVEGIIILNIGTILEKMCSTIFTTSCKRSKFIYRKFEKVRK